MNEIVVFNQIEADLAAYKAENEKIIFDYEDEKGNKAARSHCARLRKVKTHIAEIHKKKKAEVAEIANLIDYDYLYAGVREQKKISSFFLFVVELEAI